MNTHKETAHHIALQIEELGNQPQHHIDLAIGAGAIDVVISPDEPVIETWVGDQLEDLINPVSEVRQAGECPGVDLKYHDIDENGKMTPVFTQYKSVLMEESLKCIIEHLSYVGVCGKNENVDTECHASSIDDLYSPPQKVKWIAMNALDLLKIDNRTDKEKAAADILAHFGWEEYDVDLLLDIIRGKEIHGVKWSV